MSTNATSAAGPPSEPPAAGGAADDVAIPDSSDVRRTGSDQAAENRKNDPPS
jgi:hypothetical protein